MILPKRIFPETFNKKEFSSTPFAESLPNALQMVLSNGLFMVSISAIFLNLILNGKKAFS